MSQIAYIAANRFGMGSGPTDAALTESTVMPWLWGQLQAPQKPSAAAAALASARSNALKLHLAGQTKDKVTVQKARHEMREIFIREMRVRLADAVATPAPLYERLVNFWSNHFTISVQKGSLLGIAVAYEREAIRPHITGRFEDMLLAVVHHPTMLAFLDNTQSVGTASMVGMRKSKGINENLAREIMELHTLGVNGGYSQADVTSFAKVLTGWTKGGPENDRPDGFAFVEKRHEPGAQTILGKHYAQSGEAQGIAVLRDLANHPATARFIATKLARHFVADDPPEAAIATLAASFTQSGGDLKTVYRTLLELPQAWSLATPKIKSSYDLVVSAMRLCAGGNGPPETLVWAVQSLRYLGDVPFYANSPAGFADMAKNIAGPEAVLRRIEWAKDAAGRLSATAAPFAQLAQRAIGPIMSAPTRAALASARDQREGIALLLASPEFQRR
ncbi:MAG: DUF1800 domain-containing protein [Pseudomonadota bacterium]